MTTEELARKLCETQARALNWPHDGQWDDLVPALRAPYLAMAYTARSELAKDVILTHGDRISVSGVMLRRVGDHAVVEVEIDGRWVEVIREALDGNFSHIVEPRGIRRTQAEKA